MTLSRPIAFSAMNRRARAIKKTPRPRRRPEPAVNYEIVMRFTSLKREPKTYVVRLLLILVPLLVGGSLGLIRSPLLLGQGLPPLTEKLANLAECDTGVLFAHILALLVGEE